MSWILTWVVNNLTMELPRLYKQYYFPKFDYITKHCKSVRRYNMISSLNYTTKVHQANFLIEDNFIQDL